MKYLPELIILLIIAIVVLVARRNPGENVYKFFVTNATRAMISMLHIHLKW